MSAGRSLIALLVGTVVFFAVWFVALKPSSSTTSGGKATGLGQYQSAINAAHQAAATAAAGAAARAGAGDATLQDGSATSGTTVPAASTPAATTPSTTTSTPTPAPTTHAAGASTHAAAASKPAAGSHRAVTHTPTTPAQRLDVVERALTVHRVVAMLFYNPAGPDDQAVKQELSTIPTHGGKVVKLEVPLSELTRYPVVVDQVMVSTSPTLVMIDKHAAVTTIIGYTTAFEIGQRVDDALAG
jgi:hypothetical protein